MENKSKGHLASTVVPETDSFGV